MAWLGKFTVNDFAGAVTKLSESVKNIEKNFDSALGFESNAESSSDGRPVVERSSSVFESLLHPSVLAKATAESILGTPASESSASHAKPEAVEGSTDEIPGVSESRDESSVSADTNVGVKEPQQAPQALTLPNFNTESTTQEGSSNVDIIREQDGSTSRELNSAAPEVDKESNVHTGNSLDQSAAEEPETAKGAETNGDYGNGTIEGSSQIHQEKIEKADHDDVPPEGHSVHNLGALELANGMHPKETDEVVELKSTLIDDAGQGDDRMQKEMRMMEAALQGAARQAQSKADEISRLMMENEQLKSSLEDLKRKPNETELDSLREEYQQRISAAERKMNPLIAQAVAMGNSGSPVIQTRRLAAQVYALTKERDMLRREQNRKSDSSILLKEKDEIIKAVMAEGEELSKKQAAQEGTIKKLRAQVREMEEEKNRLTSKLQVEEAKVESMRKDKAATEKALQEAVERGQVEMAAQKEFYSKALNEAKEAAALAEARVDSEARADLDRRLKEASEREIALVQNIAELRQALTRTEQQAASQEDRFRYDIEDLEKRCQAAEARYEELSARMPDSTRPLLRHIEALQESMTMRTDAWNGVERSLNSRLQQAEAKAAAAQEKERAVNERLTQTLSRMAVMEAQVSCLRAEQAQLQRSLEKERQRASENRQEYLAATEAAATHEGRARQIEEEIKTIRKQYKRELNEEKARREALEQEIEQERAAMAEYEKRIRAEGRAAAEKAVAAAQPNEPSVAKGLKRWPSMSSQGSMEESLLLQQSPFDNLPDRVLGHSDRHSDRFSFSDRPPSPSLHFGKSTYEQLEILVRHKEGEVASYATRLAALELTRDSLAEELVKATTQCEALRAEATLLPGMRAELESLRRRHTSALELMGERDEEVEELRADLSDVKQMYREQIDMLVGQIERLSAAVGGK